MVDKKGGTLSSSPMPPSLFPSFDPRETPIDLFPPIEPYASGMLRVDEIHTLYWETCGNPKGVPVVFLHGGPGAGASATQRRFFDPSFWRIVVFDQRGAGRSTPLGELRNNTTDHLIRDIETLRAFLGIERWHVFGGSWGSTLALAYGQAHPARCLSFVLRGVCLLRQSEVSWFMSGMRTVFPEAWESFASFVPEEKRERLLDSYYEILTGPDGPQKTEAVRRWLNYETFCSNLLPAADPEPPLAPDDHRLAMPAIEAHYFLRNRFAPDDALLRNIGQIRHIPAIIAQGRYDMVCPIATADELRRAWHEAAYWIVPNAGHSAMEPPLRVALVAATEKMKSIGS